MLVTAYAEKFENVVVYSRKAVYAPDDKWKVDQFIFGLRVEIADSVSHRELTTYAKLLRQCYVVEDDLKKV